MPGQVEKYINIFKREQKFNILSASFGKLASFIPIVKWLPSYKRSYICGDIIAGLTIGLMVIPQSLAYAKLATLPFEYGLYSSFVGPILYSFMGTTKDCAIGPSSIIALFLAQSIISFTKNFPEGNVLMFSFVVTMLSGMWLILLGVLKLGAIFQFVSNTTITAFTTGASVVVCVSQFPQMIGVKDVNTHQPVHLEIIQMFRNIKHFDYQDFLFGISSAFILILLMNLTKLFTTKRALLSIITMARNIILLVVMIVVSAIVYSLKNGNIKYNIIDTIPSGFPVPKLYHFNMDILQFSITPSIITALLITLEHMGSAKSFAIQNNYTIDENQELIVLGMSNFIGSFFGSYPVTGAFSRSAVNSQSGVSTPLSGLLTGVVVIVSIQFLTIVFKFIPQSSLAALIFMSLVIKITGYKTMLRFYKADVGDFLIFVSTYLVTIFTDIKTGLIASISVSLVFLLFRLCKPRWQLLAQSNKNCDYYIELDNTKLSKTKPLLPGIVIFRWQDSIVYPNAEYFKNKLFNCIYGLTSGTEENAQLKRSWSDNKKISTLHFNNKLLFKHKIQTEQNLKSNYSDLFKNDAVIENINTIDFKNGSNFPLLRGVILDFSCVSFIDYSGLMMLVQIKKKIKEYSNNKAHLYFVNIHKNVMKTLMSQADKLMNSPSLLDYNVSSSNKSHKNQTSNDSSIQTQDFVCDTINEAIDQVFYTFYS